MSAPPTKGLRPLLIVLGALALSLMCCCGGCGLLGLFGYQKGRGADTEAKRFARTALTTDPNWNEQSLRPYLARTWTQGVTPDASSKLFKAYKTKLGPLTRLGEFTTRSFYFGSQNGLPAGTRVSMVAPASFAKARGTVTVGVVKLDGRWGIENLRVDSDAFLK